MSSTSTLLQRGLLLAGAVALPLLGGAAVAQTAPATPAAATATTSTTPAAVAADKTAADKTGGDKSGDKRLGALKATPAEKKAAHDKLSAGRTVPKTAAVKSAHLVKQSPAVAKSGGVADTAKPAAQ